MVGDGSGRTLSAMHAAASSSSSQPSLFIPSGSSSPRTCLVPCHSASRANPLQLRDSARVFIASAWEGEGRSSFDMLIGRTTPEKVPDNFGRGGWYGMVFSGLGPAGAAVFTNPFDVAKVRMQLQGEASSGGKKLYKNVFDCISKTLQSEGIEGTQRGLTAAIIREGSKNFFRIGLFEPVLDQLHGTEHRTAPVWKRLVAGGISGAVGAMICNPIEIVKTRLQASSVAVSSVGYQGYKYKGFIDSFRVITKQEGAAALWLGTGISTIRSILATSANMTVNSISKEKLLHDPHYAHLGFKPGAITDGVCAMFSGLACVAANNPADVIRTRLYNQPFKIVNGGRVGEYYSSSMSCAMSILRSEGPLAFWKGFTGHYLRTGPHYIVCFIFIGYLQRGARYLKEQDNRRRWENEMKAVFTKYADPDTKTWTINSIEKAMLAAEDSSSSKRADWTKKDLRRDAEILLISLHKNPGDSIDFEEFKEVAANRLNYAVACHINKDK